MNPTSQRRRLGRALNALLLATLCACSARPRAPALHHGAARSPEDVPAGALWGRIEDDPATPYDDARPFEVRLPSFEPSGVLRLACDGSDTYAVLIELHALPTAPGVTTEYNRAVLRRRLTSDSDHRDDEEISPELELVVVSVEPGDGPRVPRISGRVRVVWDGGFVAGTLDSVPVMPERGP